MASASSLSLSQAHHFVSLKLTPKNFLHWKAQVEPFLQSQHLLGYVTGAIPRPSPDSATTTSPLLPSTESPPPPTITTAVWDQQDALLRSLLTSSISDEVFPIIIGATSTSKAIWDSLHNAYASPSNSRILSLHLALQDLQHQPDELVTKFLHRAKSLADELAAAGHSLSVSDFNLHIFRSLRSDFREVVPVLIGASSPLSFDELYARLLSHEFLLGAHLKKLTVVDASPPAVTASAPANTVPPAAHATTGPPFRGGHAPSRGRGYSSCFR